MSRAGSPPTTRTSASPALSNVSAMGSGACGEMSMARTCGIEYGKMAAVCAHASQLRSEKRNKSGMLSIVICLNCALIKCASRSTAAALRGTSSTDIRTIICYLPPGRPRHCVVSRTSRYTFRASPLGVVPITGALAPGQGSLVCEAPRRIRRRGLVNSPGWSTGRRRQSSLFLRPSITEAEPIK
jgi:hypothetical protein